MKDLLEATFEELKGRVFEVIQVVEMLCEVCEKPLARKEKILKRIQIVSSADFQNLLTRTSAHDRAEVDLAAGRIYFYDHDLPGDIHPECVEKL